MSAEPEQSLLAREAHPVMEFKTDAPASDKSRSRKGKAHVRARGSPPLAGEPRAAAALTADNSPLLANSRHSRQLGNHGSADGFQRFSPSLQIQVTQKSLFLFPLHLPSRLQPETGRD